MKKIKNKENFLKLWKKEKKFDFVSLFFLIYL